MLLVHPNPQKTGNLIVWPCTVTPRPVAQPGPPPSAPQNGAEPGERALGPLCPIPSCIFPSPLVPPHPQRRSVGRGQDPLAGAVGRGPLCNRTPLRGPAPGMPAPRGGCQGLTKGERL